MIIEMRRSGIVTGIIHDGSEGVEVRDYDTEGLDPDELSEDEHGVEYVGYRLSESDVRTVESS